MGPRCLTVGPELESSRLFLSMNKVSSPAVAVVVLSLALSHRLRAQARKPPQSEAT
jgi:hypothetical protein